MALRPAKAAVEAVTLQLLLKKSTFGFWFVILYLREFTFCLRELGQSASDSENSHAKGSVCVARFSWGDTRRFSRSFQRAQAIFQRELECACVFCVKHFASLCRLPKELACGLRQNQRSAGSRRAERWRFAFASLCVFQLFDQTSRFSRFTTYRRMLWQCWTK